MVAAPPLTVEDYQLLPETGPRFQLVEGDLYRAPTPNRYHQHISRNLEFILFEWIRQGKGARGELYDAPFDVYLDEINVFQPDIVYIAPENLGILSDRGCEGAPDLVVEILSPKTRRIDLELKRQVFARQGVKELWIIDPEPRTLDIFELPKSIEKPAHQYGESAEFSSPLLPGLTVRAREIFAI